MKRKINDTSTHIQNILITGYRNMSPSEKMSRICELTSTVQQFALARIRKQYGDISEREQRLRLAALWLDRKTMIHAFGWDPEIQGY